VERRLSVHARAARQVVLLLACTATAAAAPKGKAAKAAFDRGVAAYKAKDWPAAATALSTSYNLEPDPETLFAWAQAERQQEHCEQAIELYDKLLDLDLPTANKQAITVKRDECREIIVASMPPPPEPAAAPVAPAPPAPVARVQPTPRAGVDQAESPPWWRLRGGWFVAGGIATLGTGGFMLMRARQLDRDATFATNYFEVEDLNARAKRAGALGLGAVLVGGGLTAIGVVDLVRHKRRMRVTAVVDGSRAGVVAFGQF
jgi:hypothetical protein